MPGTVAMLPKRLQAHDIPKAIHVTCVKKSIGVSIKTFNSQKGIYKMHDSVYNLDFGTSMINTQL